MQIFLFFWLIVVPTAAIFWLARDLVPAGEAELSSEYFRVTPLFEIVWRLTLYAFVVGWVTIVVTSLLGCLFIRWTAVSPGLYPSRGLRGALLMYRMKTFNNIQRLWTWTITGQYLRALAGMHFPRFGRLRVRHHVQHRPGGLLPPTPKFSSPMDVSRTCSIVAPSTSSCATSICPGIFSAVTIAWRSTGISRPTSC